MILDDIERTCTKSTKIRELFGSNQHAQPPSGSFTSFGVSFRTTSCTKEIIKENKGKQNAKLYNKTRAKERL